MKQVAALLAAALLLAAPTAASAQSTPSARDDLDPKSPSAALALSLGFTAAGYASYALMVENDFGNPALGYATAAAIALGPTAGHWYAGETFTRGLGLRLGGGALAVTGIAMVFESCPLFASGDDCHDSPGGAALLTLGAVAFVYGTLDDIFTAPRAARRYNQRARARRSLSIAPAITDKQATLVVAGTF